MSMERISPPPEPGADAFGLRISAKEVCPVVEPGREKNPRHLSMVMGFVPARTRQEPIAVAGRGQIRHVRRDGSVPVGGAQARRHGQRHRVESPRRRTRNRWDGNGNRQETPRAVQAKSSADRTQEATTATCASLPCPHKSYGCCPTPRRTLRIALRSGGNFRGWLRRFFQQSAGVSSCALCRTGKDTFHLGKD